MNYYDRLADGVRRVIKAYGEKSEGRAVLIISKSDDCFTALKDIVRFLVLSRMDYQMFDMRRLKSQNISLESLPLTPPPRLVLDTLQLADISMERLEQIEIVLCFDFDPVSFEKVVSLYGDLTRVSSLVL